MTVLEDFMASMDADHVRMFRELRDGLHDELSDLFPSRYKEVRGGGWTFVLSSSRRDPRWKIYVRHEAVCLDRCSKIWHMWQDFPSADQVAYRGGKLVEKVGVLIVLSS